MSASTRQLNIRMRGHPHSSRMVFGCILFYTPLLARISFLLSPRCFLLRRPVVPALAGGHPSFCPALLRHPVYGKPRGPSLAGAPSPCIVQTTGVPFEELAAPAHRLFCVWLRRVQVQTPCWNYPGCCHFGIRLVLVGR